MAKSYRWQDEYKKSDDKIAVLREFVSEAVHMIHENIMEHGEKLEVVLKTADQVARRIAAEDCEIEDGWKLHKTWFRAGFVQLALYGVYVSDWENSHRMRKDLKEVCESMGWDFEGALYPKATRVLTISQLDFFRGYDDEGGKLYGKFRTLLEPMSKYPEGSVYESMHSSKQWEFSYLNDESECVMIAEEKNKHGKFQEITISKRDLHKMKRVA
jgi:hypothetical protein